MWLFLFCKLNHSARLKFCSYIAATFFIFVPPDKTDQKISPNHHFLTTVSWNIPNSSRSKFRLIQVWLHFNKRQHFNPLSFLVSWNFTVFEFCCLVDLKSSRQLLFFWRRPKHGQRKWVSMAQWAAYLAIAIAARIAWAGLETKDSSLKWVTLFKLNDRMTSCRTFLQMNSGKD